MKCDVSKEDDARDMVAFCKDTYARLDYAFNNAGERRRGIRSFGQQQCVVILQPVWPGSNTTVNHLDTARKETTTAPAAVEKQTDLR